MIVDPLVELDVDRGAGRAGRALIAIWPTPGLAGAASPASPRRGRPRPLPGVGRVSPVEVLFGAILLALVAAFVLRPSSPTARKASWRIPGSPTSRRARRPSTARSATPSSTTRRASSPRRTSGARTPSCAGRRSRSSIGSRSCAADIIAALADRLCQRRHCRGRVRHPGRHPSRHIGGPDLPGACCTRARTPGFPAPSESAVAAARSAAARWSSRISTGRRSSSRFSSSSTPLSS